MARSFLGKLLQALTLLAIFGTPLIVLPERLFSFTTSKSFFFVGLAELCFFLLLYLVVTEPLYRPTKKELIIFSMPALLLILLTVSGILAPNRNLAFWSSFERGTGLIFLYHSLAFALVVASLARVHGRAFLEKVFGAVFLSGVILAISSFLPAQGGGGLSGNSSYAGAYLIFSFFIGALFLFQKRKIWQKFFIFLALIPIFLSPFVIRARGASIALGVGIFISLFVYLATRDRKVLRIAGVTLLSISLAGLLFTSVAILKPTSAVHQKFVQLAGDSRFIFWQAGLEGIKERPLLGWGPENYSVVFAKYFNPYILEPGKTEEIAVDKPHNVILELFVAGGIPGGTLFILLLISFFALPIYLYRKKVFTGVELSLLEGLFFAYFLQDMIVFDTVFTYMTLFTLFGVLAGSISLLVQAEKSKAVPGRKPSLEIVLGSICILLFIPAWIFFVHLPSKKAKAIYALYNNKTAEGNEKDFSAVSGISPMGRGADVGYLANTMVETYQTSRVAIGQDPKLVERAHTDIHSFLTAADKLSVTAQSDFRLWLACAELSTFDMDITSDFTDARTSKALVYLDRAAALSPNNPRVYFEYAQVSIYKKEFAKAHSYFLKAYELDPKIPLSKEYLDKFEQVFGTKF